MAKTLVSSRRTRGRHEQPNDWFVLDVASAKKKIEESKSDPKFGGHEGKMLQTMLHEIVLARAEGAYSEYGARFMASNGNWPEYQEKRRLGLPISRKFMDVRDFMAVEKAVLDHWMRQPRLDWDAASARAVIYAEGGEKVLPHLCTSFIPPAEVGKGWPRSARQGTVRFSFAP